MHILEAALVANLAPARARAFTAAVPRRHRLRPCALVRLTTGLCALVPLALLIPLPL